MSEVTAVALEAVITLHKQAARIGEAQHVINLAAGDGFFDQFVNRQNGREVWRELKDRAMDLLAGQYPELDVKVVSIPGSNEVDLKVILRRP